MHQKTIKYGDWTVPVLVRHWVAPARLPYRKTYRLNAGQHWSQAPTTDAQWEHYAVLPDGQPVPVGYLVVQEFVAAGASAAAFTEQWAGRCVLVGPELTCLPEAGQLHALLEQLRRANGGRLGGLPDVIALFSDGSVVLREIKNVAAKDKLGPKQHGFARAAQQLLGARLNLAVVEWGRAAPLVDQH